MCRPSKKRKLRGIQAVPESSVIRAKYRGSRGGGRITPEGGIPRKTAEIFHFRRNVFIVRRLVLLRKRLDEQGKFFNPNFLPFLASCDGAKKIFREMVPWKFAVRRSGCGWPARTL